MNQPLALLNRAVGDLIPPGDGHLLGAFLDGRSEAAFEALVRRHGPMVFAVCRRVLRHPQDAEDAFQATFLVLARRAADVWPREAVGSWLYGVARRVALKARSARARRRLHEQPLNGTDAAAAERSPPDLAEVLGRLVGKLPEAYRAAVVACDLEGLSRRDAAERLGWKEGTLSGRLARARQLLAARLRRAGLSLPAGGVSAVLGTGEAGGVPAELIGTTVRAAAGLFGGNLAAGVSAPVAALTEGVVRGMVLTKMKAAAAVALAACAIGFGAWSAAGAGNGPGAGDGGAQPTADGQRPGGLDIPLGWRDAAAQKADKPPAEKLPPELERMQGQWWILAKAEGDKYQTFDPNAAQDPRQFAVRVLGNRFIPPHPTQQFQFLSQEMKLALDPSKDPPQIDLIHDAGRLTGIYEFPSPGPRGGLIVLRLLFTLDGVRPAAFRPRGQEAIELTLGRYADPKKDPSSNAGLGRGGVPPDLAAAQGRLEVAHAQLEQALKEIRERPVPKDLDGFELRLQQDKARIQAAYQLVEQAEAEVAKARLRVKPAPRLPPAEPPARPSPAERLRLQVEADLAQAQLDAAQAQLDKAKADSVVAAANYETAKARLDAARAKLAELGKSEKPADRKAKGTLTVHVRPLKAGEMAYWQEVFESDTVLDILGRIKDGMPLKPDAVTAWVVREEKVMPVDLAAIGRGETATNYQLRPGDKVFVQEKSGK